MGNRQISDKQEITQKFSSTDMNFDLHFRHP